jgi:hypothetical protein
MEKDSWQIAAGSRQRTDDKGQTTEDRDQTSEVGGPKTELKEGSLQ